MLLAQIGYRKLLLAGGGWIWRVQDVPGSLLGESLADFLDCRAFCVKKSHEAQKRAVLHLHRKEERVY
jgi:hypothetical protein